MDIFVWNDSFVTGEPVVDAEHQGLVRLVNWLIEHQTTSTPAEEIDKVLVQLVNYAVTHFQHEEELMQSSGCDPRFAEIHHNVHADFGRQVVKMREMPAGDQEFLLRFLSSWLAHHILGMDQSMARQIRKIRAGVSAAQAFEEEKDKVADPAMASLLAGMNTMFRLIAARNDELQQANATLEAQVAARTEALSQSNEQLLVEQERLRHAMQQVEITQKKLLESEHKRAEAAKRNMAQLLSQIIDGDPVPTFVIDANHRITHWNKACAAISSLPAADMVGTSEHWKAFYPERRPLMADLIVDGGFDEQFLSYYQNGFRRSSIVAGAFEGEASFRILADRGAGCFTLPPLFTTPKGRVSVPSRPCRMSPNGIVPKKTCCNTRTTSRNWSSSGPGSWPRPMAHSRKIGRNWKCCSPRSRKHSSNCCNPRRWPRSASWQPVWRTKSTIRSASSIPISAP